MKALISREAGGPDTLRLQTVGDPIARAGQLIIETSTCGLNFSDLLTMRDLYQVKVPRPFIPGAEVAGRVIQVGEDVDHYSVGDRIMGRCGIGGLAERLAIDAEKCARMPPGMQMHEAAAFQFAYETAFHAIHDRGRLRAGETALVLGGAGGVSIASIQVAKSAGARVVSLASSEDKLAFALRNGADDGIVCGSLATAGDRRCLLDAVRQCIGTRGADVVIDPVGGDLAEIAFRAGGEGVRYLAVGFTAGIAALPLNLPLLKSGEIHGVNWRSFVLGQPEANAANRNALFDLYERGAIKPPVTVAYPLERGAEAYEALESRNVLGKVVVTVRP